MRRASERASAVLAVVIIPLLLAVLPLPAVLAVCDQWPLLGGSSATPRALADRVRRWLRHGRGPWKSSCLTRSLILYALLRRHGHRPHISLGVEGDAREFVAHAWVSLGGVPVDDAPEMLARFQPLMVHGG
jgi:hypothetical protein